METKQYIIDGWAQERWVKYLVEAQSSTEALLKFLAGFLENGSGMIDLKLHVYPLPPEWKEPELPPF